MDASNPAISRFCALGQHYQVGSGECLCEVMHGQQNGKWTLLVVGSSQKLQWNMYGRMLVNVLLN